MHRVLEHFCGYIAIERGLSRNSVAAYRTDLSDFISYLLRIGKKSFSEVTRDDIIEFLGEHKDSGMEPASLARRLVAIKVFFKYLFQEKLIPENVTTVMDSPKLWRILPEFISSKEVEALMNVYAVNAKDFLAIRNRAILEVMYACGLRVSEAASLKVSSINFDDGVIRVFGKGSKERIVPIVPELRERIQAYLSAIRAENICLSGEKALFLTKKGNRISRSEVYRAIRRQLALFGIPGKRSPHVLRHTFATHMMNSGADLREIQELLGHASLSATQVYTHNSIAQLKEVYDAAHPHAREH